MTDPLHESLVQSVARWKSTDTNDSERVGEALARIYGRLNRPAPTLIWCDSPWQLSVMPFLMHLVCFEPTAAQRRRLGETYDYSELRRSIRTELSKKLTADLWSRALRSALSQVPAKFEPTQAETTDEAPQPSVLELAASTLTPGEALDLEWSNHLNNEVRASVKPGSDAATCSNFTRIRNRLKNLVTAHRDYLPETLSARGLNSIRRSQPSPPSREITPGILMRRPSQPSESEIQYEARRAPLAREIQSAGPMKIAFERNFRTETGLSVKNFDGSELPSLGSQGMLAFQFQEQLGEMCAEICSLLTSQTEMGLFQQAYEVFKHGQFCNMKSLRTGEILVPTFLPKCFTDNDSAVLNSLLQSDVLAIAKAMNSYELFWSSWSLEFIKVCMQLDDSSQEKSSEQTNELLDYRSMLDGAFMYVFEDNFVYACKKPTVLLEENWQLHSYSSPAIEFADGYKMYCWRGIKVNEELINTPEILTVDYIDNERNAEVRRVLMERYGANKYLVETASMKVAEDSVGVLYYREIRGQEMAALVQVENKTAEADGTRKQYFLRVPPSTRTPREGIAWTFGLREDQYNPQAET